MSRAFFPPWAAAETVACALWPTMHAMYPQQPTQDRKEGIAAHWVAGELHHGRIVAEGQIAPNGIMLTEEIIESGEAFANALDGDQWGMELALGQPGDLNWGRPDARRLLGNSPANYEAGIKELKHGFTPVDAFENWQLINYAKLLWVKYPDLLPDTPMEFEVIQPRVYRGNRPNVWRTTLGGLQPYFERLDAAHAAALEPSPMASTGEQCDHCPGRHACPTLQASALRVAHHRGESPPMELTDEALGREAIVLRRSVAIMKARLTGLEADAESRLQAGRAVAFHALVRTQGREVWNMAPKEVTAVGAACGVDVSKPGVLTPAQARKAGLPDEVVAGMAHRPGGALKLVEDDGREAAKVFDAPVNLS